MTKNKEKLNKEDLKKVQGGWPTFEPKGPKGTKYAQNDEPNDQDDNKKTFDPGKHI